MQIAPYTIKVSPLEWIIQSTAIQEKRYPKMSVPQFQESSQV